MSEKELKNLLDYYESKYNKGFYPVEFNIIDYAKNGYRRSKCKTIRKEYLKEAFRKLIDWTYNY